MVFVIPYFIPHQGCAHSCLFCNQNSITGKDEQAEQLISDIENTIEEWLGYKKDQAVTHFAFYGGSFTCLELSLQEKMLHSVAPWIEAGKIDGIRLSTRPDCISAEICDFLANNNVKVVELGVQSLDDKVLLDSKRGHDSADCEKSVKLLQEYGFQVGIQLMVGLPGETRNVFCRTIKKTIQLEPSFVRIYPVLVVEGSGLARLYTKGDYKPLSLDKAVVFTNWARDQFLQADIPIVRMGLQPSESLESSLLAGPYHPAFGELVLSRWWFKKIRKILGQNPGKKIEITISHRDLSSFNGERNKNKLRFKELGIDERLEVVVDKNIERGSLHFVVC